jgi:DnaJ-class molecular chaperone
MTHTYNCELIYHHEDSNHDSAFLAGDDNLEKAKGVLIQHIEYYKSIECIVTSATIHRVCKTCNGTGKVFKQNKRNKFLGKYLTCPDCKGIESEIMIENVI